MSHLEYNELMSALSFIWDVRTNCTSSPGENVISSILNISGRWRNPWGFPITWVTKVKGKSLPWKPFWADSHSHMAFIKNQLQLFLYEFGYGRKANGGKAPGK
ncbi:MAG: hypothetical protein R2860_09230 [Desulfobacterales bacterium]